jgi:hypothetical protein
VEALKIVPPVDSSCRLVHTQEGWQLHAGKDGMRRAGIPDLVDNWTRLNGLTHRCLPKYSNKQSATGKAMLALPDWVSETEKLSALAAPLPQLRVMQILRELLSLYRTLWMRDLHIPLLSPEHLLVNSEHVLVLPFYLETFRQQIPEPPADPADFAFASPELNEEPERVGPASGVYNLGMLALYMLRPAEFDIRGLGMSQLLQWKRPAVPHEFDPEAARLLVNMLQPDPGQRPSGPDAVYADIVRCCDRMEAAEMAAAVAESNGQETERLPEISAREPAAIIQPKAEPAEPVKPEKPQLIPETETETKTCIKPDCHTEMRVSALFCRICGTFQEPAGTRICPHCNAAVPAGLSYCNQCERVLNA